MISKELQIVFLFDQARTFREEGKSLHAMQLYRRILSLEPLSPRGYLELSSLYTELMDFQPATKLLQHALTSLPGAEELVYTLGECYLHLARYDDAIAWFRKIEARKIPNVHYNLGLALLGKKEYRAAADQFHLTIDLHPDFPRINGLLGEVFFKMNDPPRAIRHLKREIRRDPYHAANHHYLGLAHAALGDWEHAYDELTLAVDTDPDEAENWRLCGEALCHLHRFTEAEHYVRKALDLSPATKESRELLQRILDGKISLAGIPGPGRQPIPRDAGDERRSRKIPTEKLHYGELH